jgi:hypothetical protein
MRAHWLAHDARATPQGHIGVKCPLPGCDWSGPFKDLQPHVETSCDYMPHSICDLCGKYVRSSERGHDTSDRCIRIECKHGHVYYGRQEHAPEDCLMAQYHKLPGVRGLARL